MCGGCSINRRSKSQTNPENVRCLLAVASMAILESITAPNDIEINAGKAQRRPGPGTGREAGSLRGRRSDWEEARRGELVRAGRHLGAPQRLQLL